ncbi:Hypothetical protein SMAX5B_002844 [Scophthalmus maximus]|uniref:Uncharacterized protein n=1 Tax=Scophthalmus maximus TaxID=52904 RepID=A0A2U9CWZ0_SCOMX|nr:Hypothetical protein SMAX5B_002844 [Scophthalmus maximus]
MFSDVRALSGSKIWSQVRVRVQLVHRTDGTEHHRVRSVTGFQETARYARDLIKYDEIAVMETRQSQSEPQFVLVTQIKDC